MKAGNGDEASALCVEEKPCGDWKAARQELVTIASLHDRVYFRGHSEAEWRLESKLGRLVRRLPGWDEGTDEAKRKKAELGRKLLHRFRESLVWLPGTCALSDSEDVQDNEFVALAQHYGLPTELLDWSRSPYIAAFFAFEGDKTTLIPRDRKVAIWALDAEALETLVCQSYSESLERIQGDNWPRLDIVQITGNTNRRMIYQEGLFTRAFMVEDDIEEYLRSRSAHAQTTVLTKIVIRGSEQAAVLRELQLMAITPVTLMNDPTGAAATAFNKVIRFLPP